MVGPWISFLPSLEEVVELSDLEFIRDKALAGDWVTVTGTIDAVTNEIAYTPATGKTFFLVEAKVILDDNPTGDSKVVAALKVDGVIKDTTTIGVEGNITNVGTTNGGFGYGFGFPGDGKFIAKGLMLVGNSSKKITIENIVDAASGVTASLSGWIQDT